eukprot:412267-Pyramimonas_sp.AAC.1
MSSCIDRAFVIARVAHPPAHTATHTARPALHNRATAQRVANCRPAGFHGNIQQLGASAWTSGNRRRTDRFSYTRASIMDDAANGKLV